MNRWPRTLGMSAAILAISGAFWIIFRVVTTAGSPPVSTAWIGFAQPAYTVDSGQSFTATLNVQNAENLGGWELLLSFDPAHLALEGVTPGAFLSSTGRATGQLGPLGDPATGQVWIGSYSQGTDTGVTGSGALAQIRLRALASGEAALALGQVQLAAVQGVSVTVQPAITQDSQVSIPNAAILAAGPGWNLVALPREPSNPAPGAALVNAAGSYDLVYAYNACDTADPWKKYDPAAPPVVNDLTAVDPGQGLWLRATRPVTFTVSGAIPALSQVPLCAGWNLIGYPSAVPRPIAIALASIAGDYDLVYAYLSADPADPWKKYDPAAPPVVNDLAQMGPGLGYWIRVTRAVTLTVNW